MADVVKRNNSYGDQLRSYAVTVSYGDSNRSLSFLFSPPKSLVMARLARIVIPGLPHHVTQRGNRRETVFFGDKDYAAYLEMLREACVKAKPRSGPGV